MAFFNLGCALCLVTLLLSLSQGKQQKLAIGDTCVAQDGVQGVCKLTEECPANKLLIREGQGKRLRECSFHKYQHVSCCPVDTSPSTPTLPPTMKRIRQSHAVGSPTELPKFGDSCVAQDGVQGVCKFTEECPANLLLYREGKRFRECSFHRLQSVSCCPVDTSPSTTSLPPTMKISLPSHAVESPTEFPKFGDSCVAQDGVQGVCKFTEECPANKLLIREGQSERLRECSFHRLQPVSCCPAVTSPSTIRLPTKMEPRLQSNAVGSPTELPKIGESCAAQDGVQGVCKLTVECPANLLLIREGQGKRLRECWFHKNQAVSCCPVDTLPSTTSLPPTLKPRPQPDAVGASTVVPKLGDTCVARDGVQGVCKFTEECPANLLLIQQGQSERLRVCSFHRLQAVSCCPVDTSPSTTTPTPTLKPRLQPHAVGSPTEVPKLGNTCDLSNGEVGLCTKLASCPSAGIHPQICSFEGLNQINICCPQAGTPSIGDRLHESQDQLSPNEKVKTMCERYAAFASTPNEDPRLRTGSTQEGPSEQQLHQPKKKRWDLRKMLGFRILGGEKAGEHEFPHMVALGFGNENDIQWSCGGSLISERFVLTAAHCLQARGRGAVRWVRLGAATANEASVHTQKLAVKASYRHDNYTMSSYYHDIALLELQEEVRMSEFVHPACLHTDFVGPENGACIATGWGAVNSSVGESLVLMKVEMPFQELEMCNSAYRSLSKTRKLRDGLMGDTMICVGDPEQEMDTCQGDSGGPIQVISTSPPNIFSIVGVTSFGMPGCGEARSPAVYTRVSYYVPWITSIVWPAAPVRP